MTRVAVVGSSGFVGEAVVNALRNRGIRVLRVKAPRLTPPAYARSGAKVVLVRERRKEDIESLAEHFSGITAVVNCAGDPDASSRNEDSLNLANAEVPVVVGEACTRAGVQRLVHISSAVVQGRRSILDDTLDYHPFSAYARSKILGETLLLGSRPAGTVIYRPPSVHATSRRVTKMTARIARSPLASVAAPGDSPTPQALLQNVADAIAFLAICEQRPPSVVIHPWEGLTTESLLMTLGNRKPSILPRRFATSVLRVAYLLAGRVPRTAANIRRVEMIWLGQAQAESWLTRTGWEPKELWGRWII